MLQSFKLNLLYFWRMLFGALRYADWETAYANDGMLGWIVECGRALTGFSAWPFFVPREAAWSQAAIQDVLARRGIVSWGWGTTGRDYIFHVTLRQAHWAQYLLLEAGVPLHGRLLTGNGYGARRQRRPQRGFQAPKGGYRPTRGHVTPTSHTVQPELEPMIARLVSPMGRLNRLVDRLAAR